MKETTIESDYSFTFSRENTLEIFAAALAKPSGTYEGIWCRLVGPSCWVPWGRDSPQTQSGCRRPGPVC